MQNDIQGIPCSITDTNEWKDLEARENTIGPDRLLEEIIGKKLFTNAEIMWVLVKRFLNNLFPTLYPAQ